MSKYDYNNQYDKDNCKQYKLKLNYKTDADLIAILDSLPNKQGYLKALIISDNQTALQRNKDV